ncbi:MAG TPA: hypothetical protein VGT79_09480 [Xanthomonadaceae bacterium]|nr:hypothetical protein [Xanthomonadaceae bacterium]
MNRRTVALALLALALGGCATYGPGYTYADGSYAGPYNGGYYAAPANGSGDYYYDYPQVTYNGYPDYYYGPYGGYGYGYSPWWGFGYDPWFFGSCRGDCDGDRDDWHHHHWSGQRPWPHAVSGGHAPRGGMSRGGSDHHPPPRSTQGPTH